MSRGYRCAPDPPGFSTSGRLFTGEITALTLADGALDPATTDRAKEIDIPRGPGGKFEDFKCEIEAP